MFRKVLGPCSLENVSYVTMGRREISQQREYISHEFQNVMCIYCLSLIVPEGAGTQKEASFLGFPFCHEVYYSDYASGWGCEESH